MIVTDNKPSTMGSEDANAVPSELPPPYVGTRDGNSGPAQSGSSSSGGEGAGIPVPSSSRLTARAPQKPASNFVIVKRTDNGITDSYVIDTQLHVPEGLLSPLSPIAEGSADVYEDGLISGEKPHIYLESTHGSINADIWLIRGRGGALPGQDAKGGDSNKPITDDRALINVKTTHMSVNTKLVSSFRCMRSHCFTNGHNLFTVVLRHRTAIHTLLFIEVWSRKRLAAIDLRRTSNNHHDIRESHSFSRSRRAMHDVFPK